MIQINDPKTHDIAEALKAAIKARTTPMPFGAENTFNMTLEEVVVFVAERLMPFDVWTRMPIPPAEPPSFIPVHFQDVVSALAKAKLHDADCKALTLTGHDQSECPAAECRCLKTRGKCTCWVENPFKVVKINGTS